MNARSDHELLAATRRGDREAFADLVSRHQQMVCALAYARTGSFAASEDVAQETFLAAWRRTMQTGAPENFRAWLCGTVRNLAARFHRDRGATTTLEADTADEHVPAPRDELAAREDEALVWTSLEQLPETYREPLVLFYRQEQSVREVAATLELSEEAVRQRLSRGRALLQESVQARVESVLRGSTPGKAFTLAVLAAIPAATSSAQAAAIGAAAVKGGSLLGTASLAALASALSGVLVGGFSVWLGIKQRLEEAESEAERRLVIRMSVALSAIALGFGCALPVLVYFARSWLPAHAGLWGTAMLVVILGFVGGITTLGIRMRAAIRNTRRAERLRRGLPAEAPARVREYRSAASFLGLPLIHVNYGGDTDRGVACGWMAMGTIALSPLLAIGGVAVGGIAVGGFGVGLLCFSGVGIGVIAFCGLAAGVIAMGGLALGDIAYGGLAWAWHVACGGLAIAHDFAVGGSARALHANDAVARAFLQRSPLLSAMDWMMSHVFLLQFFVVLPLMIFGYRLQRRIREIANEPPESLTR
jgi:RNA polymerase sigma factor (sigma-70 family)